MTGPRSVYPEKKTSQTEIIKALKVTTFLTLKTLLAMPSFYPVIPIYEAHSFK